MNRRERAVVLLVVVTFLAGTGILHYKRMRLARQAARNPIGVVQDKGESGEGEMSKFGHLPFFTFYFPIPLSPSPLDLNQATQRQLDMLPGIGPVLASRIIEYRQRQGGFHSVSELRAVSGIGSKRYASLKDLVVVGLPDTVAAPDSGR